MIVCSNGYVHISVQIDTKTHIQRNTHTWKHIYTHRQTETLGDTCTDIEAPINTHTHTHSLTIISKNHPKIKAL